MVSPLRAPNVVPSTREGAKVALDHLQEWAKWMSGIQTAALAALGLLLFKEDTKRLLINTKWETLAAVCTFVLLGTALFASSWILSSLPSLAVRIYSHPDLPSLAPYYDIYEQRLFGWFPLSVGYLLTLQHWLWALCLISFGANALLVIKRGGAQAGRPPHDELP